MIHKDCRMETWGAKGLDVSEATIKIDDRVVRVEYDGGVYQGPRAADGHHHLTFGAATATLHENGRYLEGCWTEDGDEGA